MRRLIEQMTIEGGGWTAETVHFLVGCDTPICAHLGLPPQTVHALGGCRVQGRTEQGDVLRRQAQELVDEGASMFVREMAPVPIATALTPELPTCHTIGIGAGNGTAGQVLVLHDMLSINLGKNPRFVRNSMADNYSVQTALAVYVKAVKDGSLPDNTVHARVA
jgi:3-methyl-2-oxobutanoate hydroxymethyltransferase